MQKHVNIVDLVKSFPTNILLQNLASIQKRTSPVKFAHLAEKSGKDSIPNLSTKVSTSATLLPSKPLNREAARRSAELDFHNAPGASVRGERANLKGLVLGCIEAKFCKLESSRRDLHNALLCTVLNAQNFVQKSLKILLIFAKFCYI